MFHNADNMNSHRNVTSPICQDRCCPRDRDIGNKALKKGMTCIFSIIIIMIKQEDIRNHSPYSHAEQSLINAQTVNTSLKTIKSYDVYCNDTK